MHVSWVRLLGYSRIFSLCGETGKRSRMRVCTHNFGLGVRSLSGAPIMIIKDNKHKLHTQVHLVKNNVHYTCWVPSEGAILGKYLELEETRLNSKGIEERYFDGGWEVTGVGKSLPSSYVLERERDYKRTRKATDI